MDISICNLTDDSDGYDLFHLEHEDEIIIVIPAKAGIQKNGLDTGFRRYDGWTFLLTHAVLGFF